MVRDHQVAMHRQAAAEPIGIIEQGLEGRRLRAGARLAEEVARLRRIARGRFGNKDRARPMRAPDRRLHIFPMLGARREVGRPIARLLHHIGDEGRGPGQLPGAFALPSRIAGPPAREARRVLADRSPIGDERIIGDRRILPASHRLDRDMVVALGVAAQMHDLAAELLPFADGDRDALRPGEARFGRRERRRGGRPRHASRQRQEQEKQGRPSAHRRFRAWLAPVGADPRPHG